MEYPLFCSGFRSLRRDVSAARCRTGVGPGELGSDVHKDLESRTKNGNAKLDAKLDAKNVNAACVLGLGAKTLTRRECSSCMIHYVIRYSRRDRAVRRRRTHLSPGCRAVELSRLRRAAVEALPVEPVEPVEADSMCLCVEVCRAVEKLSSFVELSSFSLSRLSSLYTHQPIPTKLGQTDKELGLGDQDPSHPNP